jgi:hypothetical protein
MEEHGITPPAWVPKINPFQTCLPSGMRSPVPYNEVFRLERVRALNLTEMTFEEQYTCVVQLSMRILQAEVHLCRTTSHLTALHADWYYHRL